MRGCSTKRPVFFVECENHASGAKNESVIAVLTSVMVLILHAGLIFVYVFVQL